MRLITVQKILRNYRDHVWGRCVICGKRSFFFTKDGREQGHVRDSLYCVWCKSVSRKRHVAKTVIELFAPQSDSLAGARPALEKISIYSAVANEFFHDIIGRGNANFACSEYFPSVPEGESEGGVTCQNLERLTFADGMFDLVITEDVFEHVRRPEVAFGEVSRVLQPGGHHVFTIPFYFDRKTVARVDTTTEEDIYLLPPEYHGDTLRDKILVYTDFGYDLLDRLSAHGFATSISHSTHHDAVHYGIADSYVFISRKV